MKNFLRLLVGATLVLGTALNANAATLLLNYQPGPRLIDGSKLNLLVAAVNSLNGNGTADTVAGTTGTFTSTLISRSATATPAAASAVPALQFGSAGIAVYWGTGAPTISAAKGSLYIQTDGNSTSTRLYINNGTTTWIAITTAS